MANDICYMSVWLYNFEIILRVKNWMKIDYSIYYNNIGLSWLVTYHVCEIVENIVKFHV